MQLTNLFVLLAAVSLTFAKPRPVPKECDEKTMQLHVGHGHESIVKGICSNYVAGSGAAAAPGSAKKPKTGKTTTTYHRRMYTVCLVVMGID